MSGVNSFKEITKIYNPVDSGYKQVKRGEIYYVEKTNCLGSEQAAGRPGLIVGNDIGNKNGPVVLAVYLTTKEKNRLPTHVKIECREPSIALCEQVFTVDKSRLGDYIKTATEEEMEQIDKALAISLALTTEDPKALLNDGTEDDELLKLAVDRANDIWALVSHVRYIDQIIMQIKKSSLIGFLGSEVTTLENVLSAAAMKHIYDTAFAEVEAERETVRIELKKMLEGQPEKDKQTEKNTPVATDLPPKRANKKINDEEAVRMLEEGNTQKEMASHFGVTPSTMSIWVKNHRLKAEGRRCGTCRYRETSSREGNCNYLGITGHSRGCDPQNCTVYEKGDPEKKKVKL